MKNFLKKFLILLYIILIINFFINIKYNKNNFKGIFTKKYIFSINNNKKIIKNNILKKSKIIIYYGYTHCPDICPRIIEKLKYLISKKNYYKKKIIFFSIDNKRDNSELSQKYLIKLKINNIYSFTNNNYNIEKSSLNMKNIYENKILKKNKYKINHGKIIYIINKYFNIKNIIL